MTHQPEYPPTTAEELADAFQDASAAFAEVARLLRGAGGVSTLGSGGTPPPTPPPNRRFDRDSD